MSVCVVWGVQIAPGNASVCVCVCLLQIDDSATVEDLVKTICERVGISNANEYSLLDEETDQEKAVSHCTLTMHRNSHRLILI